jgi:transcriptional regulator with XRE-family HTH domain
MKEEAKPPLKSGIIDKKTVLVRNSSLENSQAQPEKSPEPKKYPAPLETQSYHKKQEQKSIPKPTPEGESLPHKEQHKNPLKITDETSIGHLLQEARVRENFSIDQVAIQTKINKSYIEAIERDDFNTLPSSVYVNAYIKRLFEQYGIDDSLSKSAIQKIKGKDIHYTVSEEILLGIEKGKQVNIEKETKLRSFKIAAYLGTALVAGVCILGVVLFLGKGKKSENPSMREGRKTTPAPLRSETVSPTEIDAKLRSIIVSYPAGNMSELKAP